MKFILQLPQTKTIEFEGKCLADVCPQNHDDTVRCIMRLYQTQDDYVCQRIDEPESVDAVFHIERCDNALSIYQFFGTEPLANYLYGSAGIEVPGLRRTA